MAIFGGIRARRGDTEESFLDNDTDETSTSDEIVINDAGLLSLLVFKR